MNLIKSKETLVWLVLAGLTAISWILGNKYAAIGPDAAKYMTVAVIALAFFKVRLVIMHFMEIETAPIALRIVFELWCLSLCLGVSWFYFMGAN